MFNLYLWGLSEDILDRFSWLVWQLKLLYWSACDLWVPYIHVLYVSSWCLTNRSPFKPHRISGLKRLSRRPTERKCQPYSRLQLLVTQYSYTPRTGHGLGVPAGAKLQRNPSAKFEQPVHLMSLSRFWIHFSLLQSCQAL